MRQLRTALPKTWQIFKLFFSFLVYHTWLFPGCSCDVNHRCISRFDDLRSPYSRIENESTFLSLLLQANNVFDQEDNSFLCASFRRRLPKLLFSLRGGGEIGNISSAQNQRQQQQQQQSVDEYIDRIIATVDDQNDTKQDEEISISQRQQIDGYIQSLLVNMLKTPAVEESVDRMIAQDTSCTLTIAEPSSVREIVLSKKEEPLLSESMDECIISFSEGGIANQIGNKEGFNVSERERMDSIVAMEQEKDKKLDQQATHFPAADSRNKNENHEPMLKANTATTNNRSGAPFQEEKTASKSLGVESEELMSKEDTCEESLKTDKHPDNLVATTNSTSDDDDETTIQKKDSRVSSNHIEMSAKGNDEGSITTNKQPRKKTKKKKKSRKQDKNLLSDIESVENSTEETETILEEALVVDLSNGTSNVSSGIGSGDTGNIPIQKDGDVLASDSTDIPLPKISDRYSNLSEETDSDNLEPQISQLNKNPSLPPPPNALYRYLLRKGPIGHALVLFLVLLVDWIQLFFPQIADSFAFLFSKLAPISWQQSTEPPKPLRQDTVVDSHNNRILNKGKGFKEILKQADQVALSELKKIGNVHQAKYRHVSIEFLKLYGLGTFARNKLVSSERKNGNIRVINQEEGENKVDRVTKGLSSAGTHSSSSTRLSARSTSVGARIGLEFELPISSKKRHRHQKKALWESATQIEPTKKKKNIVPKASDQGSGVMDRIRSVAGANSLMSRSLLGAYPGDLAAPSDAANAGGVTELARKYGYGDWSDNEEEHEQDIRQRSSINQSMKRKKKRAKSQKTRKIVEIKNLVTEREEDSAEYTSSSSPKNSAISEKEAVVKVHSTMGRLEKTKTSRKKRRKGKKVLKSSISPSISSNKENAIVKQIAVKLKKTRKVRAKKDTSTSLLENLKKPKEPTKERLVKIQPATDRLEKLKKRHANRDEADK